MIILVDVYNIAFAAQHTLGRQLESTGAGSQALYGTLRTLVSQVKKYLTFHGLFLVFDHGKALWRKELFPDYKGNRGTRPDDDPAKIQSRAQVMEAIEELYNMREWAPWYTLRMPNTEADDLIAGLCDHYHGRDMVIISNDKDMRQLLGSLNPYARIFVPMRNLELEKRTWHEVCKVKSKSKKNPGEWCPGMGHLYCQFRAFVGDSSDNVPGVPGWGELTAAKVFDKLCWEGIKGDSTIEQLKHYPEKVLQAADVSTWKSLGQKTRENWHIYERNYEIMSLVIGAARLPGGSGSEDENPWQNWITQPTTPWAEGRDMMWQWMKARQFNTLLQSFDNFDMMGTRIK